MRVLVLGNSHVAAIRAAAAEVEALRPGWSFAFFAAPRAVASWFQLDRRLDLTIQPRRFAPDAPFSRRVRASVLRINGTDRIALRGFDIVLWVGCMVSAANAARMIAAVEVEGTRNPKARDGLSAAAFRAILDAMAERDLPGPDWDRALPVRLFAAPPPRKSERVLDLGPSHIRALYARLGERPDQSEALFSAWLAAAERAFARRGIELLRQPAATLAPGLVTAARYSTGSLRLRAGETTQPGTDISHMNAEYGKELLEALIARVESAPAAARAAE